jgi:hypothetical protein
MKLMPSYLTVEEAAEWTARISGQEFTPRNILALAEGEVLPVYVVAPESTTFLYPDDSGDRTIVMKGELVRITRTLVSGLLATGETLFAEYVKSYNDGSSSTFTTDFRRFVVPIVKVGDCRFMREDISRLASSVALKNANQCEPSTRSRWELNEPKRFQGYRRALFEYLKQANEAGKPLPTAHDVMEHWRDNPPPPVYKVNHDGILYYGAKGETGEASAKAIGQAINGLVRKN